MISFICDVLSFIIPLFYSGAKDWKFNVSEADIRVAKKLCTIKKNTFGKNNASLELIEKIMKQIFQSPKDPRGGGFVI